MKIAFSGAGYIINIHAQAAKSQADVELSAVVEKYADRAAALAEKFHIRNQYETVEQLLKAGDVDALVIGTPNFLHAPQAVAALKAGVHVLVEKPMAINAREAEKMVEASQRSGAILMVAHCWRFDEDVLWLKKESKRLGRIIRTKGYGIHTHWGPAGWFTQKQFAGGGALADMGIHALDTARFLLGDPKPVSVYAKLGTHYGDFDVDDTGVILVEWENGATSYIESGWWQPHADGPEAATQLYGTQGFGQLFPTQLELPNVETQTLDTIESGLTFPRLDHCPQSMYDAQMAYFVECIRNNKTPLPGAAEGLANIKVVDAAYKSSRTGKVVTIK
ncbi:MAG TPA: Gfo/Idh/MocA family oxidoreductase [Anaerolineales bacterium]|nr:Gfo/Idh/MocA family oxidoreductase [Anaerolineales bacterium]